MQFEKFWSYAGPVITSVVTSLITNHLFWRRKIRKETEEKYRLEDERIERLRKKAVNDTHQAMRNEFAEIVSNVERAPNSEGLRVTWDRFREFRGRYKLETLTENQSTIDNRKLVDEWIDSDTKLMVLKDFVIRAVKSIKLPPAPPQ